MDNGAVNITNKDIEVTVENMSGSGEVNLATNGETSGKFNVQEASDSSLNVNLMDEGMTRALTADEITSDQAKKLLQNVGSNTEGESVVSTSTEVAEGLVNNAFGIDANGKTTVASVNTLMQSALELAASTPLTLNRIMMNDVRKRLGDIRTSHGTYGAWVRYDGGELSGHNGFETDFNTVQVGIDSSEILNFFRIGAAFSYTDGDSDYLRGSGDNASCVLPAPAGALTSTTAKGDSIRGIQVANPEDNSRHRISSVSEMELKLCLTTQ